MIDIQNIEPNMVTDILISIRAAINPNRFIAVLFISKSIFMDKWQLMLEIGHHMFTVIDMARKLIIIGFERRWNFEDRDFC